jgi:LmbE family N-acetylglucosaminyl deacetylase
MENKKQILLAVLAHPDDESFGMGGTLALYAQRGAEVHLICATRGEVGTVDAEHMHGFSSIAELREGELRCAAENLGLKGVYFLDYRDSGMAGTADNEHPQALAAAPLERVVADITQYIRQLCPQVILTFDPIGGYRHPDHIKVHQATVQAFFAAGDPDLYPSANPVYQPKKLYYHTFSRQFLRLVVRLLPIFGKDPSRWGRNGDINLAELANVNFPVHALIDFSAVGPQKAAASICHASQGGRAMSTGLMGWAMRLAGQRETFMRAYPPPEPGLRERDLFGGIA